MNSSKLKAAIYGLAIGDALGVPVEFMKRGTFEVKEMNVVEEVYNNKPVFYIMISLIIVGVISIVFVGLIFNKKKKRR